MDTDLGRALAATDTSNAWSTLDAVANKVGKRLGRAVPPRELDDLMMAAGDAELLRRGVWRTSFGAKFMPIVLVNPAFGRASAAVGAASTCTCHAAEPKAGRDVQRYFGSQDYNAGRHCSTASAHRAACPMWRPPVTSHLHSWRRGYDDPGLASK